MDINKRIDQLEVKLIDLRKRFSEGSPAMKATLIEQGKKLRSEQEILRTVLYRRHLREETAKKNDQTSF